MDLLLLHTLLLGLGLLGPVGGGPDTPPSGAAAEAAAPGTVWVEGEDAASRSVRAEASYDDVDRAELSGGAWLSHASDRPGRAGYGFDIAQAGDYDFWWRGNVRGRVFIALDGGAERPLDLSAAVDVRPLGRASGTRDLGWVKVGRYRLQAGTHAVAFRLEGAGRDLQHGAIDCFCLAGVPFEPRGTTRPAALRPTVPPAERWIPAPSPLADAFSPEARNDFSATLEAPAGKQGFLLADGERLRFEASPVPVRFWGTSARLGPGQDAAGLLALARLHAKAGLNLVRVVSVYDLVGPLQDGRPDEARADLLDWFFYQCKSRGVYTDWCFFRGMDIGPGEGYPASFLDELPKEGARGQTRGFVAFQADLQRRRLDYMRAMLRRVNAYTGLCYADDPALALVEVEHEDSVFGHFPLSALADDSHPAHAARLRAMLGRWAKGRYAGEEALREAWGPLRKGETWAAGEFGLFGAWELGAAGPQGRPWERRRAGDFVAFLSGLQKGWNQEQERALRDAGFRGVSVSPGEPTGGAACRLAALDCAAVFGAPSRHGAYGGGPRAGSQLARPGEGLLSIGLEQVADRPFACGEWAVLPPYPWRAEAAPLLALYGAGVQGWDMACALVSDLRPPEAAGAASPSVLEWAQLAAFAQVARGAGAPEGPAILRRGFVEEDRVAGVDMFTASGNARSPYRLLALGRTLTGLGGKEDYRPLDPAATGDRPLVAADGQLTWDAGREVVLFRGAGTQAALGRLGGAEVVLSGLRLRVRTGFASLAFTPLDGKPFASSGRVLLTALARETPADGAHAPDGHSPAAAGGPRLLLEPVQAAVAFTGRRPLAVQPLDAGGLPAGAALEADAEGWWRIDGTAGAFLYEIRF